MGRHEKILKREDGSQIKIEVEISTSYTTAARYYYSVWYKKYRAKNWIHCVGNRLTKIHEVRKDIEAATQEEILQAMTEAWELLKPKIENI